MRQSISLIIAAAVLVAMVACGGQEVRRVESGEVIDLSGNWNDVDSREVAKVMINDSLSRPWIENHVTKFNRKPVVKVGPANVRGNGDIINTEYFTDQIIEEFVNSGRVRATRATGDEWKTLKELAHQDKHASDATRKKAFEETGADYLMTGLIVTQDDQHGRQRVRAYNVRLQLVDIQTGEIRWIKNHQLKKHIKR